MKKKIILLLLSWPLFLHAQKKQGQYLVDSLQTALPKTQDGINKAELFCALSKEYQEINPDESMKYAGLGLDLSEKISYKNGIANAYNLIGQVLSIHDKLTEALEKDSVALKLFETANDKNGIGKCYLSIGIVDTKLGNLPEALKVFLSLLKLKDDVDKSDVASCYLNIGVVYKEMKNYPRALQNFDTSYKLSAEFDNKGLMAFSLQNIASVYNLENNTKEALKNVLAALSLFEEIKNRYGIAICDKTLGYIYTTQNDYPAALKNLLAAAQTLEDFGATLPLADVLGGIGAVYYNQRKFSEAETYFNKALLLGQKNGSLAIISAAEMSLCETYAQDGKYKEALEAHRAYIVARDSIFNEENIKKTVQTQMQYDFDKKESVARAEQGRKDALVKIKLQQKNIFIYGTLSAFIVVMIISALLVRQYKLKAEHQKIDLEQKQLRAQMNPHFIFNCLNSIQHFVVTNDVKNANKYLTGFALLMRQTLENSKAGTISVQREVEYLKNYLSLELVRFEDKFTYEINCAGNIDANNTEIPAMIIQPFVENAIRHGLCFLKNRPGLLKINFYLKDGFLFCEIEDNGVGREQSQKLKMLSEMVYESQGIELTKLRLALASKSYRSEFDITVRDKNNEMNESEGTIVTIKFPAGT